MCPSGRMRAHHAPMRAHHAPMVYYSHGVRSSKNIDLLYWCSLQTCYSASLSMWPFYCNQRAVISCYFKAHEHILFSGCRDSLRCRLHKTRKHQQSVSIWVMKLSSVSICGVSLWVMFREVAFTWSRSSAGSTFTTYACYSLGNETKMMFAFFIPPTKANHSSSTHPSHHTRWGDENLLSHNYPFLKVHSCRVIQCWSLMFLRTQRFQRYLGRNVCRSFQVTLQYTVQW